MKISFAILLSGLLTLPAWAGSVHVQVKGMVCAFCAQGIEKKLRAEGGVEHVKVSLEKQDVLLSLKEGQGPGDARIRELLREAGYEVQAIHRGEH